MTIVITGTTGFVGSHLKSFLLSKGYTIAEVNRYTKDNSFTFNDTLSPACKGEVWIHLAGKSKDVQKPELLNEYLQANVELTKKVYQAFINDDTAATFIYASSVKAAAARVEGFLTEEDELDVDIPYGLSKRLAEKYLFSVKLKATKKLIILRPAMIYGENSKGNLYSLYSFVKRGLPYPFAAFSNSRSLLAIENLAHVILHIVRTPAFNPGVYNVADDGVISTNEIIELIGKRVSKRPVLWRIPSILIKGLATVGDKLHLPFNTKIINKLTDNYAVSNKKIIAEMGEGLPYTTRERLGKLFASLNKKV